MKAREHLVGREPCPFLPGVAEVWTAERMLPLRGDYGGSFYLAALSFAQSLWLEGKPAQSLLQLNKAMMAGLSGEEDELRAWPLPYAAKVWVMEAAGDDEFLGNPVRHYQHLATRMSGPRSELRTWRAWACFHLAEKVLPEMPRDEVQIEREGVEVPTVEVVRERLRGLGLPGEERLFERLWAGGSR